ncbi:MAG TPA: TadE/TadG family type IV pilus assembly protein [Candidatus Limnocylindrales bacterium]|nr:TadE/TadG family type IV pilus assembly protein [Candidatus Limnocylindrales bacterium]
MSPRSHARERGQSVVEFALLAPIMIFLLFAILDLSRIYTEMASVESAAREAADYGTSLGAEKWVDTAIVDDMRARACTAASNLPDFQWTDTDLDGKYDTDEPCTNPGFDWCLSWDSSPCSQSYPVGDAALDPTVCNNPSRPQPCRVTVTMSHVFYLFVPLHLDFFGVQLGLPASLSFDRDSTFAMTDIEVDETSSP